MPRAATGSYSFVWTLLLFVGCDLQSDHGGENDPSDATFVGRQDCASCHEREDSLWQGSHHDLAMDRADESTVLGDFDNATHDYYGVTSTFYRKGDEFFVRTDGPSGALEDFRISYTFGAHPLQQYLIEFPGGRYQALNVCWDTRPADDGGQRWFHLYPDEKIDHDDILHWTGPYQNWNHMCAECHSTGLEKGYDADEKRYETTWSEIDVSCEACHGPGSRHADWAKSLGDGGYREGDPVEGLVVRLKDQDGGTWIPDPRSGTARRSKPRMSHAEIETCARCHSRRQALSDDYAHGRALMQTHRPALLRDELYHADGQILDEVYVYGSFLQSKMFQAGVTCSNCHMPHSLQLAGSPDAVCGRCHYPPTFATRDHHFHKLGTPGASCVDCHMPPRKYMVVDPRRDHSIRVPRPDLTVEIGTPNACNDCHRDRTAEWAAAKVTEWYGPETSDSLHYGEALHAARAGLQGAEEGLLELIENAEISPIVRASAIRELRAHAGPRSIGTLLDALQDEDPLVRFAAVQMAEVLQPPDRLSAVFPLLSDSVFTVRIEAARVLAPIPRQLMSPPQIEHLDVGIEEYRRAQLVNIDRADAHLNLGVLHAQLGELELAEKQYRAAQDILPNHGSIYINLADLYRQWGREAAGETVLREALVKVPDDGDVHHALGLLLVRRKNHEEAREHLSRAVELSPNIPHYSYVYGIALQSLGHIDLAIEVLESANERFPSDREILYALATIHRDNGSQEQALQYARRLLILIPGDPGVQQLVDELSGENR